MLKCATGRVQGYSHKLRNQPCQDSFRVVKRDCRAVLAVADGHGNEIHKYSADGSRIAVETAVDILKEILEADNPKKRAKEAMADLPERIELEWKNRVRQFHYDLVKQHKREIVFDATRTKPSLSDRFSLDVLYGTTLLAVLCEKDFLLALQIGDGDIVYIDDGGNMGRVIESEMQIGSATNSLCMMNSNRYFRVNYVDYKEDFHPVLVMLSTDGYSNSYSADKDFLHLAEEYQEIFSKYDEAAICEALPGWLEETSRLGSGDDITVAIAFQDKKKREG